METTNNSMNVRTLNVEGDKDKKRKMAGEVTPDKKQRQGKIVLRGIDEIEPRNLLSTHPELYYVTMKGEIDLIYCDQGATEAFVYPVITKMFSVRSDDHTGKIHQRDLKEVTRVIAVASRRKSKELNEPEMKSGSARNETAKFKKCYFVRLKEYDDYVSENKEGKIKALEAIAKVNTVIHNCVCVNQM